MNPQQPSGYSPQQGERGSKAVALVAAGVVVVLGGAGVVGYVASRRPAQPNPSLAESTRRVAQEPPEPSHDFQRFAVAQVIEAFRGAGAEVGAVRQLEPSQQGMAPITETDGVRFLIPSMGRESGGRVFSFATPSDLDAKRNYYVTLGRTSAIAFSWVFTNANILVQINGTLPRAQADQYRLALESLR